MTWAAILGWLKRIASWCAAHPAVTAILALLGALSVESARLAHQKRKTAAAETRADVAEVDGQIAVKEAHADEAKGRIAEAEKTEAAAEGERRQAKRESDDQVERRREALKRWEG